MALFNVCRDLYLRTLLVIDSSIIMVLSIKLENHLPCAVCFILHLASTDHHAFIAASVSNCFSISLGLNNCDQA